jgi:hypothetical protein
MNGYNEIQKILKIRNWISSISIKSYKDNKSQFNVTCDNNHNWDSCLKNLKRSKNCFKCWNEKRKINDNIDNVISEKHKATIFKGDVHEKFVCDIFNANNIRAYRPVIGNNTFDIMITIDNINRGIQVKELRKVEKQKNGFITCFPTQVS